MKLKEAEELALSLMDEHNLWDKGWTFSFDNAKRRFGHCRYRDRTITISRHLTKLNDEYQVRNIILHEIAHALLFVKKGKTGHNSSFYLMCERIGAEPSRCYSSEVKKPEHRWEGECPNCGSVIKRHRLKKGTKRLACSKCCKRYSNNCWDPAFLFQWTSIYEEELEFNFIE